MNAYIPEFGECQLGGGHNNHSFGDILISRQSLSLHEQRGYLFGWIEIGPKINAETSQQLMSIWESFEDHYYYMKWGTKSGVEAAEANFEKALQHLNQQLAHLSEVEPQLLTSQFRSTVGIVYNNHILFSIVNVDNVLIIHQTPQNQFQVIDILDQTHHQEPHINPNRLYGQIVQGRIGQRDALFFCNSNVLDFVSYNRIKEVIVGKNASEAATQLREYLGQTNNRIYFAALFVTVNRQIKMKPAAHMQYSIPQSKKTRVDNNVVAPSQASLNQLSHTQKQTSQFLQPTILPNPKSAMYLVKKNLNTVKGSMAKITDFGNRFFKRKNRTKQIVSQTAAEEQNSDVGVAFVGIGGTINKSRGSHGGGWAQTWHDLPSNRRLQIMVGGFLILIFLQSLVWQGQNRFVAAQEQNQLDEIEKLTSQLPSAEARVIFGDESGARSMLQQIKQKAVEIEERYPNQSEPIDELLTTIENELAKLRHQTIIDSPQTIATFSQADQELDLYGLAVINDKIYSFDNHNAQIAAYDQNNQDQSYIPLSVDIEIAGLVASDQQLIIQSTDKRWFRFDPISKTVQQITFDQDKNLTNPNLYEGRMYFLNANANQITRFNTRGNDFVSPTQWLQEQLPLDQTIDLTVDGSIYLLEKDANVIQLQKGKIVPFAIDQIEPAWEQVKQIKTKAGLEYLAISDPQAQRVAIYSKQGRLLQQYTSNQWTDIKDIEIGADGNSIFVLNNQRVDRIDLTTLP